MRSEDNTRGRDISPEIQKYSVRNCKPKVQMNNRGNYSQGTGENQTSEQGTYPEDTDSSDGNVYRTKR